MTRMDLLTVIVSGIGMGLLVAAKSSAGIILLFAVGIFHMIYLLKGQVELSSKTILYGVLLVVPWCIFYSLFLAGGGSSVNMTVFSNTDSAGVIVLFLIMADVLFLLVSKYKYKSNVSFFNLSVFLLPLWLVMCKNKGLIPFQSGIGIILYFALFFCNLAYLARSKVEFNKVFIFNAIMIFLISLSPAVSLFSQDFIDYLSYKYLFNELLVSYKNFAVYYSHNLRGLFLVPAYLLSYYGIKILMLLQFVLQMLNWKLLGIFSLFTAKTAEERENYLFVILIVILSVVFTSPFTGWTSSSWYFFAAGNIAMSVLFVVFINDVAMLYSTRWTKMIVITASVMIFSNYWSDYMTENYLPRIISDRYFSTNHYGRTKLDHDLYSALRYIRDTLPNKCVILHNQWIEPFNSGTWIISAFSERKSYIEDTEYCERFVSKAEIGNLKAVTVKNRSLVLDLFNSKVDLKTFEQFRKKGYVILGDINQINALKHLYGDMVKEIYGNTKYRVLSVL